MAVVCDGCGSREGVRRAAITVWNGNVFDLCKACWRPLSELIDRLHFGEGEGSGKK